MNNIIELNQTRAGIRKRNKLSSLQTDVIERIVAGESYQQIADDLGFSEYTVVVIVDTIQKKFASKTLPEAVSKYLREH